MRRRSQSWLWLLLALFYAGLNLYKPIHVDDAAYYYYARQLTKHPFDPYGFWILWYNQPDPACKVLSPPVLPACWALAITLFGERPWLWKLILVPWCLLLTWALDFLARRFAPGLQRAALLLLVFSPAILPSLNFMLDIPALALALAAIAVFLKACARDSWSQAALAGLLAGVAMQTKYTGFVVPGVMLVAAFAYHRLRLWPAAALVAVQVFSAWELLLVFLYGESHFLISLRATPGGWQSMGIKLGGGFGGLFGSLGELLAPVFLIALVALGVRGRPLLQVAFLLLAGHGLLLFCGYACSDGATVPGLTPERSVHLAHFLFGLLTVVELAAIVLLVRRGLRETRGAKRKTLFLLGWLGMELLGYLVLSPFPAVRRLLGVVVVLTLLLLRLATPSTFNPARKRWVHAIVAGGVCMGLAYAALDFREAQAQEEGAEWAASWIRQQGGGRVWYLGHWGFQHAAEERGMCPMIAALDPAESVSPALPISQPCTGDWLVAPDSERIHVQSFDWSEARVQEVICLELRDPIPLRTLWCFYSGAVPLEPHCGARFRVRIYWVTASFTARRLEE